MNNHLSLHNLLYSAYIALLICLLILISTSRRATAKDYGFTLKTTTKSKLAMPGDFVTLIFRIENTGEKKDTYHLETELPSGWSTMGKLKDLSVKAGETETKFITVKLPSKAKAGSYSVSLSANSTNEKTLTEKTSATITVESVGGIKIKKPREQRVKQGESVSYTFVITNTGNESDKYRIEARSGHNWIRSISEERIDVFPGESKKVEVSLEVPEGTGYVRDSLVFTVNSLKKEGLKDQVLLFTTVLPPSPEAVGGTLYPEIPAWINLHIDRDIGQEVANSGYLNLSGSGSVGDGFMDIEIGFSDLFSDRELDIESFDYRFSSLEIEYGNVDEDFTPLTSVDVGKGLAGAVKGKRYRLSFIGTREEGYEEGGAQLSLSEESYRVDYTYTSRYLDTGENRGTSISSVHGEFEPITGLLFEEEFAFSESGDRTGRALTFSGISEGEAYKFSYEGFSIGTRFAGDVSDRQGFRLSGNFDYKDFAAGLYVQKFRNNVDLIQTLPVTVNEDVTANLSYGPTEVWPLIDLRASLERERDRGLSPSRNSRTEMITLSVSKYLEDLNYRLRGMLKEEEDFIKGTKFRYFSSTKSIGVRENNIYLELSLNSDYQRNLSTGDLRTSTTLAANLELSTEEYLELMRISVKKREDGISLSTRADIPSGRGKALVLDLSCDISEGESSLSASFDYESRFNLTLPFTKTKGRIKGFIFIDGDGDGKKGPEERGVGKITLSLGDAKVVSGDSGRYKFPPLEPGTYKLNVEGLPTNLTSKIKLPLKVTVEKGEIKPVPVPLTEICSLRGVVFSDEDQNGEKDQGETGVEGIKLTLKKNETSKSLVTGSSGKFSFIDLLPGEYKIKVDKRSLPARTSLTTKEAIDITLEPGERKKVKFGTYQEPKEIVFGQPPIAEFDYFPPNPEPKEQVFLYGKISQDPDGRISKYKWDIDGDGKYEKSGEIISVSFEETRTYTITLSVEDSDGNTDSTTKRIKIGG